MDLGIRGRVAMVAAASKGLGKASALALAQEGCRVSICGRSPASLEAARAELLEVGGEVLAVPCDVSRFEDLEHWYKATVERFGAVDILVTNTGGPPAATFLDLSEDQWRTGVDGTLLNVVRLCRWVLPGMQARGWGRIVHLTSLAAKQPTPILTISCTLRAGISALTKTLAAEFAKAGITVNAVLPGHIMTERQVELAEAKCRKEGISHEEHFERVRRSIPMGRIGEPSELGQVVAFLCSERASYICGASLQVDGGAIQGTF